MKISPELECERANAPLPSGGWRVGSPPRGDGVDWPVGPDDVPRRRIAHCDPPTQVDTHHGLSGGRHADSVPTCPHTPTMGSTGWRGLPTYDKPTWRTRPRCAPSPTA